MKITIRTFLCLLIILFVQTQSMYAQKNESTLPKFVVPLPAFPHDVRNFTVIDTAKYIITYSVEAIVSPEKYPNDTLSEVLTLEIGSSMSKSFNQTLFNGDSILFYEYIAKGKEGPRPEAPILPVDIYKNYPNGITTVCYRLTKYNYRYEDNYPIEFKWNLSNERERILSYNCQKATCTFRGRNYTAWFTPEIPIKDGPYKFGGLPGLILKISDDKSHYIFTCIGILKPKSVVPIKLFKWQYTDITREKLNAYLIKVHKNQAQFFYNSNWRVRVMDDNGKSTDTTLQIPNLCSYNPIELE